MEQTDILLVVAFILVCSKLASYLGASLGLPTAVAMIALGLLIGPAMLGVVHDSETLELLAQMGVILLMFVAGLETDMEMMRKVSMPAFLVATGGVLLPFLGGLGIGEVFGLEFKEALFLAAILTATSVSISAQTLRELNLLRSREGTTILAAAVIDDIMGVVVLAFVFASTGDGNAVVSIGKMAAFLPVSFILGFLLTPPIARQIEERLPTEAQLSIVIAAALAYGWAAEELGGVAAVTGAYMAGILITRTGLAHSVSDGLSWIAYGFFVPLFFVGIGFKADFNSIADAPDLVAALIVVSILGKIVGCYVPARLTGFDHHQSLIIGVGMMSRGEVALVIAAAGLAAGAVGASIFSAAILMTLVTTIATPLAFKLIHSQGGGGDGRHSVSHVSLPSSPPALEPAVPEP
ncbi:MAG: cation:proton antiporter [Dehalococcoidia bacterium]